MADCPIGGAGIRAGDWSGRCSFLTLNGLCALHTRRLKPLEGRTAVCAAEGPPDNATIRSADIVPLWDTPLGRAVVDRWLELHPQHE